MEEAAVSVAAGDILIVPHGDAHSISNGAPTKLIDATVALPKMLSGDLSATRFGGGGATTQFVCGYFGCERDAGRLFLAGLPPLLKIGIRGDAAGHWLEDSIRHLVSEAASKRPGRTALLSKMSEALFIEALRRYLNQLSPEQTGWLAGARDVIVGCALASLHRKPAHPWTMAELSAEVGASRTVVAERFARYLGGSPMSYLAHWRLHLAARLLQTTGGTIVQIAAEVGYESEAAFNRAFKREFGLPPAQYRKKLANGAHPSSSASSPP
ncbi:MAG: AraC family transcriptional regulator [Kiloniellales bacterium]